jgi:hypothetical protein
MARLQALQTESFESEVAHRRGGLAGQSLTPGRPPQPVADDAAAAFYVIDIRAADNLIALDDRESVRRPRSPFGAGAVDESRHLRRLRRERRQAQHARDLPVLLDGEKPRRVAALQGPQLNARCAQDHRFHSDRV